MDLLPIVFVDFDHKKVVAFYSEGPRIERYVPDGRTGEFVDFVVEYSEDIFPTEDEFWVKGDADLVKILNERAENIVLEVEETKERFFFLLKQQAHDRAIILLEGALQKLPFRNDFRYFLASEYDKVNRVEDAITTLEEAILSEPSHYTAMIRLELLYLSIGLVKEATQTWQKIGKLHETHPQYYYYIFSLRLEHLAQNELVGIR